MRSQTIKLWGAMGAAAMATSACGGGINAGGETPTSNGGIAFIALAGMLILTGIIMWIFLGRDE